MLEYLIYVFKCLFVLLGISCVFFLFYNIFIYLPKRRKEDDKLRKELMEKMANTAIKSIKMENENIEENK